MSWVIVDTLACGCELIEQDDPAFNTYRQKPSVRCTGPCTTHLCRVCGDVPLADSEPDRLCPDCWEARR